MLTTHTATHTSFPTGPRLSASDEITRVREHLLGAIQQVGSRPTDDLSPAQRAKRVSLLGALIRYAVAGRFPKNIAHAGLMAPTFVDHEGTRCAMAHLIDLTGGDDLVNAVAKSANHAYVRELAADASLVAWLVDNGLTEEEAARVQPSYCYSPATDCVCYLPVVTAEDLVAGIVTETATELRVDEVFKTSTDIAVGDTLPVTFNGGDFAPGARVFASVVDGAQLHYAISEDGTLSMDACQTFGPPAPESLDVAVVLEIADGAECLATLDAVDPQWTEQECDGLGEGAGGSAPGEGGNGVGGDATGEGGDSTADGGAGGQAVEEGGGSTGCSFSALPAHEAGLLYALVVGLALARTRRASSSR